MITLNRLELIRSVNAVVADELQSIQTQLNAAALSPKTQTTVGSAGSAAALPATPAGYVTLTINGRDYVMPFYEKS